MIVLLRFNVYSTFYRHLSNEVTQQMVAHVTVFENARKNVNATVAFGKLHLASLLTSTESPPAGVCISNGMTHVSLINTAET